MYAKYCFLIKNTFLAALIVTALLMSYFFSVSPIALQKATMITAVDTLPLDALSQGSTYAQALAPDVRKLVGAIPYQNGKAVPDILPKDRFNKTIGQGYGNCSNLAFGMAVYLLSNNFDFRVVHIIPYDSFLTGNGHTLLDMPYSLDGTTRRGLVDLMEGGVPRASDTFVDLSALRQKQLADLSIYSLNRLKDDASPYYGEFLKNAAIGVVPREEVARYFAFINRVYVSLGNKRLERIIFSGIAVVVDIFPHTYVLREDYLRLFDGKSGVLWAAKILLWLLRLLPFFFLLFLISFFTSKDPIHSKEQGKKALLLPR